MRDRFHYARVSFYGDSLTAGFDAESQAATYVSRTVQGLRAIDTESARRWTNANQYGGRLSHGRKQMLSDLAANPDLVVLQFGENDSPHSPFFSDDYRDLIHAATRDGRRPLIAAFGVWNPYQDADFIQMSTEIRELVTEVGSVFVDLTQVSENSANRAEGRNVAWLGSAEHMVSDSFHPNDLGHAAMADALLAAVADFVRAGPARLQAEKRAVAATRGLAVREMV